MKVFYAPLELTPGYNFIYIINEALSKARFYLLLLSEEYLQAEWPLAEHSAAIYADPSGKLGRVIPILVKPCRIPPLLQFRTYINFTRKEKEETEKKKLKSILTHTPIELIYPSEEVTLHKKIFAQISDRSYEPDYLNEVLYSNLLPVSNIPDDIWSAPTSYKNKYEIKKEYKKDVILPPYILKNKRLYTFLDLSDEENIFSRVINQYDFSIDLVIDWSYYEDTKRWLVELLNDVIRSHAEEYKLTQDVVSRKYFFKKNVLSRRKISFKPHLKKTPRSLIIDVIRENRVTRVRHRSVRLNFIHFSNSFYLKIDPGVVFTYEGINVIGDRRRQNILCTKYLSRQKNKVAFGEFRFWAWLLSEDANKIRMNLGDKYLEIDVTPVTCNIERGIYGDSDVIPENLEAPPPLFEPEDFDDLEFFDDDPSLREDYE